jgi:hypothetical protein
LPYPEINDAMNFGEGHVGNIALAARIRVGCVQHVEKIPGRYKEPS